MDQPRVVIIGAGFGGLTAARALAKAPVCLTVVDACNHHLFQPLLYQVATGALSPAEIARPIRAILGRQKNCEVTLREVTAIHTETNTIKFRDGTLEYDYLIVAAGARHAYFGHEDWERLAPGLKNLQDALEIRRRILVALERADREQDPPAKRAELTFVVIGGGPTGVELAGAIGEIARHLVSPGFRNINPAEIRVLLVENAPRILLAFPEDLARAAVESLGKIGVEVLTGSPVTAIEPGRVMLGDRAIRAATVLWAAGVAGAPLAKSLGVPLDRAGRAIVNKDLTIPGHPNVFVIGDLACFTHQTGKPLPGVAPVAMQQGLHVASSIARAATGKPAEEFYYHDKGNLATIGRAAAIADLGKIKLTGVIAWLAWMAIHIFFLIGFRNRFVAMFNWAWTYITYDRAAMLIVGKEE
jgi:NADH dehydrogenase